MQEKTDKGSEGSSYNKEKIRGRTIGDEIANDSFDV